jgi:two-component system, NarL family, response regulator NreC
MNKNSLAETTSIKIGLVEDQFLFRQGMRAILHTRPGLEVVFESAEGYTVIDKLTESSVWPDVMLVDLSLPPLGNEEFGGKEVTIALRKHFPEIKIIILSGHEDENFIADLIGSGAHGYLIKDSDPSEVFEAIASVKEKGSYINPRTLRAIQNQSGRKKTSPGMISPLTKREEEVLQLICLQLTSEEIGEKLSISVKTVNGYRISLLEKTNSINVAGLTIYAVKNGIVKL